MTADRKNLDRHENCVSEWYWAELEERTGSCCDQNEGKGEMKHICCTYAFNASEGRRSWNKNRKERWPRVLHHSLRCGESIPRYYLLVDNMTCMLLCLTRKSEPKTTTSNQWGILNTMARIEQYLMSLIRTTYIYGVVVKYARGVYLPP